eukprot:1147889-Pelagomonas_calceolata.AAC.3
MRAPYVDAPVQADRVEVGPMNGKASDATAVCPGVRARAWGYAPFTITSQQFLLRLGLKFKGRKEECSLQSGQAYLRLETEDLKMT